MNGKIDQWKKMIGRHISTQVKKQWNKSNQQFLTLNNINELNHLIEMLFAFLWWQANSPTISF